MARRLLRVARASGRTLVEQLHRPLPEFMAEESLIRAADAERERDMALRYNQIGKDDMGIARILAELQEIRRGA